LNAIVRFFTENRDLIQQLMNPPPKIVNAEITPFQLKVKLDSGITVLMPLEHVPTLLLATEKERQDMEVFDQSLHWESLDCDLSVEGLLADAKEMLSPARKALERFFERQYEQIAA
jgi:hypothetical protein